MPTREEVLLTRKELYDLVWSTPIRTLAKEFEMSDVALAKWCRKLDVPRPSVGHWQKKEAGKKTVQPKLPNPERNDKLRMWRVRYEPGEEIPEELPRDIPLYELFETKPENRIVVSERLDRPHPHVVHARNVLRGGSVDARYGWIYPKERPCLDMNVSPGTLDRALRILDALIKGLSARGIEVEVTEVKYSKETTFAVIDNERIPFGIFESPQKGTRKESWSNKIVQAMVPSGRLVLRIRSGYGSDRLQIRDKTKPIEERLNEFIIRLQDDAVERRNDRLERERKRLEELERQRREAELRRERELEAAKFQELETFVANWKKARDIREFLVALREVHESQGGIPPESPLEDWVAWATRQADRVDPFVNQEDPKVPS